jgi:hypothetical protein
MEKVEKVISILREETMAELIAQAKAKKGSTLIHLPRSGLSANGQGATKISDE